MTDRQPMFKLVNVLDPKTGRPLRDRKSGEIISKRVKLTDGEIAQAKAEVDAVTAERD